MRKLFLLFSLIVGLLASATLQAQVNMDSYITLTVKKDSAIRLDFKAAAVGTPVRIESGSNTQNITVGTGWIGFSPYTADGTEMTIYGDITGFDCSGNGAKLTALDVRNNTQLTWLNCSSNQLTSLDVTHNTQLIELNCSGNWLTTLDVSNNMQLKKLSCHDNDFTTATLDRIYCALPVRSASDGAQIFPLGESSSAAEQSKVASTSGANATAKNWRVLKYKEDGTHTDIATTGSYVCPEPNMSSYITLTVKSGENITLNFQAAAEGTTVRIVSGGRARDITVGTSLYGNTYFTAYGTEMKIYGDLTGFYCSGNREKITALDPSHNTQLKWLDCSDNNLTSLNLSHNTQLEKLYCDNNQLTTLDVSQNTQLEKLYCSGNQLTTLDLSKNTQLKELYCFSNRLTTLDVSHNRWLDKLSCSGNNFSTQALDDIYCSLPDRTGKYSGLIYPLNHESDLNHAIVLATNKQNAILKNWDVRYFITDISIPATTGTYTCPYLNMSRYITLTVKNGETIKLGFSADGQDTIRIVSGNNTRVITMLYGDWGIVDSCTANGTTMTVYGNIRVFDCKDNGANITAIDVSHNRWLEMLSCSGNNFSTQALDDIYCSLPDRTGTYSGVIYPLNHESDPNHAIVLATNKQNAILKDWDVRYFITDISIPATTGTYTCPATDIAEATAEQALTLYPNPVADVLYISSTARTIRVYNIYGIEVAHATDTDRVDVAHLPAGVYTVRADGTVAKMVKR